ncbi:hypothetical protein N7509_004358 [Penicillium cosmopolitanum]|uniref:Homeobox domain-containing protein n=1 Tax=Penicillium cosmopolitanum TaxID=1131564 RepID=A0A9X0BCD6_9EURO|nr:uncharacterized protein N7509_004358 [Penicillium cosmopolitanum]KAJ5404487.1 hypothetical protein N7509_004358 [Penicillium cosmopolitanum]
MNCSLCLTTLSSETQFERHVGRHLQELALFALPKTHEDGDYEAILPDTSSNESNSVLQDTNLLESSISNKSFDLTENLHKLAEDIIDADSPHAVAHILGPGILEGPMTQLWTRIQHDPDNYVLTSEEFALFNVFLERYRGSTVAQRTVARFWANYYSLSSPDNTNLEVSETTGQPTQPDSVTGSISTTPPTDRKGHESPNQTHLELLAHHGHPFPTEDEKQTLMELTGLTISQISNWFINARRGDPEALRGASSTVDPPTTGSMLPIPTVAPVVPLPPAAAAGPASLPWDFMNATGNMSSFATTVHSNEWTALDHFQARLERLNASLTEEHLSRWNRDQDNSSESQQPSPRED